MKKIIVEKVWTHVLHVDVRLCTGLHEFDTILQRQLTAGDKVSVGSFAWQPQDNQ